MSILAIVSKAEFEKALASPTVGDLWKLTTYDRDRQWVRADWPRWAAGWVSC